jgi:hypothetical protein
VICFRQSEWLTRGLWDTGTAVLRSVGAATARLWARDTLHRRQVKQSESKEVVAAFGEEMARFPHLFDGFQDVEKACLRLDHGEMADHCSELFSVLALPVEYLYISDRAHSNRHSRS